LIAFTRATLYTGSAMPLPRESQNNIAGVLFMLAAMAVLPFLDAVAKILGQQNVPVVEIVWARLIFGIFLLLPFVLRGRDATVFIPIALRIQTIRCLANIAATICFFWP
jgi:drug/metabolite transporter (DMT)-like permease